MDAATNLMPEATVSAGLAEGPTLDSAHLPFSAFRSHRCLHRFWEWPMIIHVQAHMAAAAAPLHVPIPIRSRAYANFWKQKYWLS